MKQTKAQLEAQKAHIWQLLCDGMKPHEIHVMYGYNEMSMYNWFGDKCKENVRAGKQKCEVVADNIISLRRNGLSYGAIAKALDIGKSTVATHCRAAGLRDVGNDGSITGEEFAARHLDTNKYEYVGGYTNNAGRIDLRCRICGNVNTFSCVTVRLETAPRCPDCIILEKSRKAAVAERQRVIRAYRREAEREEIKRQREAERKSERESHKRIAICDYCGRAFITYNKRAKRCSAECSKKYHNHICSIRNEHRIPKEKIIDRDISLKLLYERDNGFCHICGMHCDITLGTNDSYYPSIDHVVPLAKGGEHSWENVKLAHRRCNSSKGSRDYAPNLV